MTTAIDSEIPVTTPDDLTKQQIEIFKSLESNDLGDEFELPTSVETEQLDDIELLETSDNTREFEVSVFESTTNLDDDFDILEDEKNFGAEFGEGYSKLDKETLDKEAEMNLRKAIRYVRNDIKAQLVVRKLLGSMKAFDVDLLDVSSKGVLISSPKPLKVRNKVLLKLKFEKDIHHFKIEGEIVRITDGTVAYGIKFSQYENEFAEHLFDTQTQLVFK
ncbi:MAG: hypothetical protein GQ569_04795 [Methylococcaceae bacterium]|nr:hypothetical protein [Methylococcaceae bacterium]